MNNQSHIHNQVTEYALNHNPSGWGASYGEATEQVNLNEDRDHILARMDKLRVMANQQRAKNHNRRIQTSFCF